MAGLRRVLIVMFLLALIGSACPAKEYPYRWVYVSRSLRADSDVADIKGIAETASKHGLNGMVLSAGLDRLNKQPPDYFMRIEQIKRICKENGIEIIPIIFSAGYGGSILSYDRNLAAGIPVEDAVFVVKDGRARLVPDESAKIANGGFEEFNGDRMAGYRFHDRPGEVSFADEQVFKSGRASLRFENFGKYEHGHARVMQEIKVKPHRCYRITCHVKTDSLAPAGCFRVQVLTKDGRSLA
ncbi:MAG: hypothetical protein ACYS8Z_20820, partial [Planctomycetota bacterium]